MWKTILEFFVKEPDFLVAEYIEQQVSACLIKKAESLEGLYSFSGYFIEGLKRRFKNQKDLAYIEPAESFKKIFGVEEVPTVPLYNWINKEWLEVKNNGSK